MDTTASSGNAESSSTGSIPFGTDADPPKTTNETMETSPGNILTEIAEVTGEKAYDAPTGEEVNLPNDIYNLFFLSRFGSQGFFYALYIFVLKMAIFTFLIIDAVDGTRRKEPLPAVVAAAELLVLPIAIAMQDDLMSSYYIMANVRYWPKIRETNPHATRFSFNMANILRGIDGHYSLVVNFAILLSATDVLGVFLNFAALQFLQDVDNMALKVAADGYFSPTLENIAKKVQECKMPQQKLRSFFKYIDTAAFVVLLVIMFVVWAVLHFHVYQTCVSC